MPTDGRLVTLEYESKRLANNPLGDPHVRRFPVWLPPQYDRGNSRRFPVLYHLAPYTGSGWSLVNWRAFDESIPERLSRLQATRRMGPTIVVFPDCFTSLGGNQYVNSSAIGRYADYLTKELTRFVDGELRTLADRKHRGLFGKSSGGYAALVHAMKYPQFWGAAASHAGDVGFETVYWPEWPAALTTLSAFRRPALREGKYRRPSAGTGQRPGDDDGRVRHFLEHMRERSNPSGSEITALMMVAMSATYDPSPSAPNGFRLPVNLETGVRIDSRWKRWLKHDPINLVREHAKALRQSRGLFLDCGWRDQYHIHYGSRRLSAELSKRNIEHRYEEFDGTHSGIDHRLDRSLPFLYRALKP